MLRLIVLVIGATISLQATIITSVSCTAARVSITDTQTCAANDTIPPGTVTASASSTGTVQWPVSASDSLFIKLTQSVQAGGRFFTSGSASAKGEFSAWLTTADPTRPGWLAYVFDETDGGSGASNFSSAYSVVIGNTTLFHCVGSTEGWYGSCEGDPWIPPVVPITLGQPFALVMSQDLRIRDAGLLTLETSLKVRLFEQDQITSVAIQDTPEPGTAILSAAAFGIALLASYRRRNVTRPR